MKTLCVAHLVRASNGLEVFRTFLSSYLRNDGGVPHRLLLIMKGFRGRDGLVEYDRLLRDVPHDRIHVRDFGYDIRPYIVAARKTGFDRYCFLNSFSVILDREWLAKLVHHMDPAAAVVGATGSWVSHATNAAGESAFRYRSFTLERPAIVARIGRAAKVAFLRRYFDEFPNSHIRTNAFLVERSLILQFQQTTLLSKLDAWKFESARSGLSRQAATHGRHLLVVGKDGNGYREDEWPESNTYFQGDQENLLVADNQTSLYQQADRETRITLSMRAWGDRARPAFREDPAGATLPR